MTFDEYAEKYLQVLTPEGRRLVQMGWNGRGQFGADENGAVPKCDGNHGGPPCRDRECWNLPQGDVSLMGDITIEDGTTFGRALVVQFPTVDDFHAAREAGQCRFTIFGGPV